MPKRRFKGSLNLTSNLTQKVNSSSNLNVAKSNSNQQTVSSQVIAYDNLYFTYFNYLL